MLAPRGAAIGGPCCTNRAGSVSGQSGSDSLTIAWDGQRSNWERTSGMNQFLGIAVLAAMTLSGTIIAPAAYAQSNDAADLAKKLSNPIADLISVPFQLNYNQGYADGD